MKSRWILLIALTLLIYGGSTWSPPLLDDADAANAETAREMVARGDWVTLHMNGVRFLEKAPVMYWAIALSYKIFGVSTFSARLPLALATLLLIIMVYAFGNWMGGERAGFYSGLSLCVGLGVYLFTRILIFEVILTLWMTVAFYFFLKVYFEELDAKWSYVVYACLAAAVLSKGLIGVVFPLGILFVFVLLTGGWKRVWQMRPISGTLLFLVLAVPWHVLAGLRNDRFFWFYFINEHVKRFLGTRYPMDYDTMPLVPFWLGHLLWLFPFSVFLPLAFGRVRDLWRPANRAAQLRLFAIIWFLVIVGFFSFSTRQEYYTFPVFPALALLIGYGLAEGEQQKNRWILVGQGLLLVIGLAVAAVLAYALWLSRGVTPTGDISQFLTSNPENYRLSLGHASDLTASAFATLRVPAAGAASAFGLGFSLAFIFRLRRQMVAASITTAMAVAGLIFFAHMALGVFSPYLSSQPMAAAIQSRLKPDDIVVFNGEYQSHSSVGFYLARQVLLLNGRTTVLEFGSHYPDSPPVFIDQMELARLWMESKRIFLVTNNDKFEEVKKVLPGEVFTLASAGGKSVYSNRR
ncbi:MAG: glycosyltransferase family 39 protein [Blastocatellia bacterium]